MPEEPDQRLLLLVEEAAEVARYAPFLEHRDCHVVTSRYEIAKQLAARSDRVEFADLTLQEIEPGTFDVVLFRVAKGKALVHQVINRAFEVLPSGGRLHLAGLRYEGTKTYIRRAGELFGDGEPETLMKSGARCGMISKCDDKAGQLLADDDYGRLRLIEAGPELSFYSKPGIYGWDKVDRGSRLLVSCLDDLGGRSVLDLGCGYGYLSIQAARLGAARIVATDNSAAALAACRRNFQVREIPGQVVPSDCGDGLGGPFDLILCNPPFHQGFSTSRNLSERFVRGMARLLAPGGGRALLVANQFVPYEKLARHHFRSITVLTRQRGFKVLALEEPIRTG
ncbi:MAG: methyltransferase [Anaerolineaceae bacterium]|nr:methyltransferase [Anaerolineaceae bacterium]